MLPIHTASEGDLQNVRSCHTAMCTVVATHDVPLAGGKIQDEAHELGVAGNATPIKGAVT